MKNYFNFFVSLPLLLLLWCVDSTKVPSSSSRRCTLNMLGLYTDDSYSQWKLTADKCRWCIEGQGSRMYSRAPHSSDVWVGCLVEKRRKLDRHCQPPETLLSNNHTNNFDHELRGVHKKKALTSTFAPPHGSLRPLSTEKRLVSQKFWVSNISTQPFYGRAGALCRVWEICSVFFPLGALVLLGCSNAATA